MNRMKALREEKGISMKEAALKLGIPYTTYVNYEKGAREPNSEMLIEIANFYNTSIDYLLGKTDTRIDEHVLDIVNEIGPEALAKARNIRDAIRLQTQATNPFYPDNLIPPGFEPAPRMVKRPLVGDIACGQPILADENIDDYVDVPEDIRCDFCLRCHGDSMIDAGIRDRDVVYIRIQPEVENGQIAAVRIGDEATLKRVYWDESKQLLTLLPANTAYSPMVLSGPALEDVQIEGRAVGYTHWMD